MKLLLLGGPTFVGRAVMDAAAAAGHDVTMFNRGLSDASDYPDVERLIGDRDGGLGALAGRAWDTVIDTSGYVPRIVGQSARLLADSVGHYVFVSSVSVYASFAEPVDESSPVASLDDPATEDVPAHYGALKAACEATVETAFPGRALHVRAGLIVGPHDPTGRFTYWPHRFARGGDVLVPGPLDRPIAFVDVRDLAEWMVDAASRRVSGPIDAVNPWRLSDVVDACAEATGVSPTIVAVPDRFLREQGVAEWLELPLWIDSDNVELSCFMEIEAGRARADGLRARPLVETALGALTRAAPAEGVGLTPEREADLVRRHRARAG